MEGAGWDGPVTPRCSCGNAVLAQTPAGNWWCGRCLATIEATALEAPPVLYTPDFFTGYRAWQIIRTWLPDEMLSFAQHLEAVEGGARVAWDTQPPARLGSAGHVWREYERAEAQCGAGHVAPCSSPCRTYGHGCGWYAWQDPADLYADTHFQRERGEDRLAYGEVALWGRVWEHGKGYRAQYAYPQVLWLPQDDETVRALQPLQQPDHAVHELAERYGIAVVEAPVAG